MIIHNTTFTVLEEANDAWLTAVETNHIPAVKKIIGVSQTKFLKLLTEIENGGITYTIQIEFNSLDAYENFLRNNNYQMLEVLQAQFPQQFLIFETTLRVL